MFTFTNFAGIVLLFIYFKGCAANEAFISLTLVFIVIFTALQLMSDPDRGHNLLVSSVVAGCGHARAKVCAHTQTEKLSYTHTLTCTHSIRDLPHICERKQQSR